MSESPQIITSSLQSPFPPPPSACSPKCTGPNFKNLFLDILPSLDKLELRLAFTSPTTPLPAGSGDFGVAVDGEADLVGGLAG